MRCDVNHRWFPFRTEEQIERKVWKKAILNAVFNSICPLLGIDNGIFVCDANFTRIVPPCCIIGCIIDRLKRAATHDIMTD